MAYVRKIIKVNSRLVGIIAWDDFLDLRDQKFHAHMSSFGWLWSYGHLKLRIAGKDYWKQMEQNNKPAKFLIQYKFNVTSWKCL